MAKKEAPAVETPKVEKAPKDIQNGITRPSPDSASGRVWAISDALSEETGEPAKRSDVLVKTGVEEINPATASTQYGRWRKYYGLEAAPRAAKAEDADAEVEGDDEDEEETADEE